MKKVINNREYFSDDFFGSEQLPKELRAQPRKSYQKRNAASNENFYDENEGVRHHTHRNEPGRNIARMQLRRLENLF